jgi:hypothetical protein
LVPFVDPTLGSMKKLENVETNVLLKKLFVLCLQLRQILDLSQEYASGFLNTTIENQMR